MNSLSQFDELLSRRLDASLQSGDAERLDEHLQSDPRALEIYLDLIELDTFLVWELAGAPATLGNVSPSPTRKLAVACVVAACGLIATIAAVWSLRPAAPGPMEIVQAPPAPVPAFPVEPPQIGAILDVQRAGAVVVGDGERIAKGDRVRVGDRLTVSEGSFVTVQLDHGVRLLVEGPTNLDLSDRDRVSLLNGRVLGTVSAEAQGFVVDFQGGAVRDLGTQFAVATSDSRPAEVKLLNGVVELFANGGQPDGVATRLATPGSVRLASSGSFEPADESSTWLDSIVAFEKGIESISGAIRFLPGDLPAPDFRRDGDPRIDVYLERAGGTLAAPMRVLSGNVAGEPGVLAPGTYDCYLLRLAPVVRPDRKNSAGSGTIVFHGPVAGWIVDARDLADSDVFVASPERRDAWLRQSESDRKTRGWEPGDNISLRPDGRTLDVTLNASTAIDEIRIFVRTQAQGVASK